MSKKEAFGIIRLGKVVTLSRVLAIRTEKSDWIKENPLPIFQGSETISKQRHGDVVFVLLCQGLAHIQSLLCDSG